jgi:hypothetical protein
VPHLTQQLDEDGRPDQPSAPVTAIAFSARATMPEPQRGEPIMTSKTMQASILAVALAGALATAASAQTPPVEGDPHHPADAQAAEAQPATQGDVTPVPAQGGIPRGMADMMGMMTPEMMQMMHNMMGQGRMPGMMDQGIMDGAGLLYGLPSGQQEEVTPEQVRLWLERELVRHGNPRLAIGEITGDDDSITATIVTVDGSLVQKLAFNRFPGLVRRIVD